MTDDIQSKIDKMKERAGVSEFNRQRKRANTRVEQVQEDARLFYRFYLQVVRAAWWLWTRILNPITNVLWKIGLFFFGWYRKLWSYFVYKRDRFGDLKFSKVRAGWFLALSLPIIVTTAHLTIDTAIFVPTYKHNETIYLFDSTDNSFANSDRQTDEFSITGCEVTEMKAMNDFSCDSNDTVYFRVQSGLIEHIYSLFTTGHIFYPDAIGAAIAPGWNVCTASSWYFRWKTVMRNTDIFPHMLAVSCKPLLMSK